MLKGKLNINTEAFRRYGEVLERFFKWKTPPLIGCDISSSSIKMVEIVANGKNAYSIDRYVIEPLPRDAVVDGNIMNLEAVSDGIKRGWRRLGSKVKNVALALPSAAVITKKIVVPATQQESDLELQVETEANQYIPFALEEVNLDFQVIGPAPNSAEDVEVLIAASRKDKIEDRVAAAEAAGLKPIVMDIESFATQTAFELIERQFPESGKDQNIAIVDVGMNMMNLNVLRNDQSIYMREQPFGGNQLTQDIQRVFDMPPEEAEAAKRNGGLPDNYESEVLAPFLDNLALEVARALQFFFTSTQFNQVNHIVLAGGCAALPGISAAVAKRTSIETMIANPFIDMVPTSKIRAKNLETDAPSLIIACGLAMRRFDA